MCYQLSSAWEKLDGFADKENDFEILRTKHKKPSKTLLARHKATHFEPMQFESHHISRQYSILRRLYHIQDGQLKKELAGETMPRVANLVKDAVQEVANYLSKFREATIG